MEEEEEEKLRGSHVPLNVLTIECLMKQSAVSPLIQ